MAEGYSSRDRPRDRPEPNDNREVPPPPLMDRPVFPVHEGPPPMDIIEPKIPEDRFRRGPPPPGKLKVGGTCFA